MVDSPIRPPTYDYNKHQSTGPLRKIKYYPDKVSIIKRFRLMPPQDCENFWYLRYIAEHSVCNNEDGWRWRFDDKLFATLRRLHNYEFKFQCPALFIAGGKSLLLESKIMKYKGLRQQKVQLTEAHCQTRLLVTISCPLCFTQRIPMQTLTK